MRTGTARRVLRVFGVSPDPDPRCPIPSEFLFLRHAMKFLIHLNACLMFALVFSASGLSQEATPSASEASEDGKAQAEPNNAVDPVGTWFWEQSFGGNRIGRAIHLRFDNKQLAGTYDPQYGSSADSPFRFGGPAEIEKPKLEGDVITFQVTRSFNGNVFTTRFWGVISGDEIAGVTTVNFGGRDRESEWLAKRVVTSQENENNSATAGDTSPPESRNGDASPEPVITSNLVIPEPTRIPDPGEPTDEPYIPRAILPGGIVMPLYPPDSPLLKVDRIKEAETYNLSSSVPGRINSIVNIHNPSIEVHFASPSMNTGAVVILAAGGGHRTLNVGTESADFVPFFYNYGVNTVILRNRLRSDGYEPTTDAVHDALQSIRLVRKLADQWNFDPNKIGIMGFSAGAELAAPAAVDFKQFDQANNDPGDPLAETSSRPDFVGIIYPGPTPFTRDPDHEVPRDTPPAFITCAGAGDRIHAIWATDYLSAMLRAGVPNVEMHIYGNGYHPGDRGATGGLTHRNGIPFGSWPQRFIEWFDDLGFLGPPGEETKAAIDSRDFVNQPPRRRGSGRGSRGRQSEGRSEG